MMTASATKTGVTEGWTGAKATPAATQTAARKRVIGFTRVAPHLGRDAAGHAHHTRAAAQ